MCLFEAVTLAITMIASLPWRATAGRSFLTAWTAWPSMLATSTCASPTMPVSTSHSVTNACMRWLVSRISALVDRTRTSTLLLTAWLAGPTGQGRESAELRCPGCANKHGSNWRIDNPFVGPSEMTFSPTNGGELRYVTLYRKKSLGAVRKLIFVYLWLRTHSSFDVTGFSAFVGRRCKRSVDTLIAPLFSTTVIGLKYIQ